MPETMPKSPNHIAFPIASPAAAHAFYNKILGCKLIGAVREDRIPSTGEDIGFLRSFYAMANGAATYQVRPLAEQDAAQSEIEVQKWIEEHASA